MNDKFTSDDILVALCQKFGNSTEIIDDVIDKKIFMTDKEKEYYLNEVYLFGFQHHFPRSNLN